MGVAMNFDFELFVIETVLPPKRKLRRPICNCMLKSVKLYIQELMNRHGEKDRLRGHFQTISVIMTLRLGPPPPSLSVMTKVADSHTWT